MNTQNAVLLGLAAYLLFFHRRSTPSVVFAPVNPADIQIGETNGAPQDAALA